ncbi:hypothetical protein KUV65_06655 [Maritalea mobilis]|uniref:hypothetical protein n=1 Tax=Maritalea mobilis TaxID=483324 RepID=UPI001C9863F0|nr:hypothetical protein [Maritalea mobilis]MBY6201035.1 hypothetical protein [Maritalea mobilis]
MRDEVHGTEIVQPGLTQTSPTNVLPFDGEAMIDQLSHSTPSRIKAGGLRQASVLMLGFEHTEASELHEKARKLGVALVVTSPIVSQLKTLPSFNHPFNVIIFNVDAFPDLGTAVDILLAFRRRASNVAVILLSYQVRDDDFGTDRRPIGDVTLRKPVTKKRLKRALQTALSRVCCANPVRASSRESSEAAGQHEQKHSPELQDQEITGL